MGAINKHSCMRVIERINNGEDAIYCEAVATEVVLGFNYCPRHAAEARASCDKWDLARANGVVVTSIGEKLFLRPDSTTGSLSYGIVHDVCERSVKWRTISTTHNALVCEGCGLRLVLPKEVSTFDQLKALFPGGV